MGKESSAKGYALNRGSEIFGTADGGVWDDGDVECMGSGMLIGRLGFCVAEVGSGGMFRSSCLIPGTKSATTLVMRSGFYVYHTHAIGNQ